jgi:prophage maintenance system killer protein
MTVYLTAEQIAEISADHGGSVDDWDGLEACAYRPQSGGFGQDAFTDLWLKAAAYLHGIASTQYLSDANKRTAWYAAVTFLRLNGYELPDVETIYAETFVQAIAQNVFNTSDNPDLTVHKAAEWFRIKWDTQRVGACLDRRMEFAFLSPGVMHTPDGPNVSRAFVTGIGPPKFPALVPLWVVARIHWDQADIERDNVITAYFVDPSSDDSVKVGVSQGTFDAFESSRAGHPELKTCGIVPSVFILPMRLRVSHPGDYNIVVDIDGETVATLPITFHGVGELFATQQGLSNLTSDI